MPSSASRSWLRRVGFVAGGALVIGLVLWLLVALSLRALVDPAGLADRLEPRASAALNRTVSIGSARLRIFPRPSVELRGLRVSNLSEFDGLPLATVDRVRLEPRLLPLLRRRVEIDAAEIRSPRVLLQVAGDGTSNYGDFVPETRERDVSGDRLTLEIRQLEIVDGRVGYRDRRTGRAVQADAIEAEGSAAADPGGGWRLDARVEAGEVRLTLPGSHRELRDLRLGLRIDAEAGPEFGWLAVREGRLTANRLTARLEGRIDSLRAARRLLDLALAAEALPLADLEASLPDSVRRALPLRAAGEADASLRVRGALGSGARPQVEGLIVVRDGRLTTPEDGPVAEEIEAEFILRGSRLAIDRLRGRLLGAPAEAGGSVVLDSAGAVSLTLDAAPHLEALPAGVRKLSGSGAVDLDLHVDARLGVAGSLEARGSLGFQSVEVRAAELAVPLRIPGGTVRLEGRSARWADLPLALGEDGLRSEGSLGRLFSEAPPVLRATLRGPRLDAEGLRGAPAEIGYGKLAIAHLGERRVGERTPEDLARERGLARPGSFPVAGEVRLSLDTLLYGGWEMRDVEGTLFLQPELAEIRDLRFTAWGGRGSLALRLEAGQEALEPFSLTLDLEDVEAAEFLAASTPLGDAISGTLSLELTADGRLDTLLLPARPPLHGLGSLVLSDGAVEETPLTRALAGFLGIGDLSRLSFSRWVSPFSIRDGALHFSDGRITGPRAVFDLSGAVGLGGGLDLGVRVRPERSAIPGGGAGGEGAKALRQLVAGGEAAPALALRVGGSLTEPRLSVDPAALERAAEAAGRRLLEERQRDVRETLEERGRDLLRGLLGGAGADTATPGGEAEADTATPGAGSGP